MSNATLDEPPICARCGILVQADRSSCGSCGTTHTTSWTRAQPQPKGGFWVAVQATFTCNACRFDSPLNHFELDEGVVCTRCGLVQRYEPEAWRELVDLAHRVGDFGWGGRQGRFPDPDTPITRPREYEDLGRGSTWIEEEHRKASPGNPLCHACHDPLVVAKSDETTTEVMCSRCGTRRRYVRPSSARKLKRLAGVLADEHEEGGREVALAHKSGVTVLSCPTCAAPLEHVKEGDGLVVCSYCDATCRISTPSHARAGHKTTPTKTWWLYFDEPSPARRKLLNVARQEAARQEKRQRKSDQRKQQDDARARALAAGTEAHAPRLPRQHPASRGARATLAQNKALLPLIVTFALAPFIGLYIWLRSPASKPVDHNASALGSDAIKTFSFDMSEGDAARLLGVSGGADLSAKFAQPGLLHSVRITQGGSPSYSIVVQGGDQLDLDVVLDRLTRAAPHRLTKSAAFHEIHVAKSLLRFDPRVMPQYRGSLQVMTWLPDARAKAMANALWSLAKFAAFGSPEPSNHELSLVNGPPLGRLTAFDIATPIEGAAKSFAAAFPYGGCETTRDLVTKKTQMTCKVDTNHPLFKEVALAWTNAENARVEAASFVLSDAERRADVSACLDKELGRGQDLVVDHASGASQRTWRLDQDLATMESHALILKAAEQRDPTSAPAWAARFGAIVAALEACKR
jgi:hypothetical protein